jgi:hypothetical protein
MLYLHTTVSECVTVNDNPSDTITGNLSWPSTLSFNLWVLWISVLILLDISKNPLENVKSRDKCKVIQREEETGIYLLC